MSTSNCHINMYIQWSSLKKLDLKKMFLTIVLRYHRLVKTMVSALREKEKHARHGLFSFVCDYNVPRNAQSLRPEIYWSGTTFFIPAGGDTTATTMEATFFCPSRYRV
jgi:hypothetical protein